MNYFKNMMKYYAIEVAITIVAIFMFKNPFKGLMTYKQWLQWCEDRGIK